MSDDDYYENECDDEDDYVDDSDTDSSDNEESDNNMTADDESDQENGEDENDSRECKICDEFLDSNEAKNKNQWRKELATKCKGFFW